MSNAATEFHVLVLAEPMTVYRGCYGADRQSLEAALTSNFQAGRSPHPSDLKAAILFMAVSLFEQRGAVAHLVRRRPDRIGTHIAMVELQPGFGVCVAATSGPGHWSVWGIPAQLAEFVTDVTEV